MSSPRRDDSLQHRDVLTSNSRQPDFSVAECGQRMPSSRDYSLRELLLAAFEELTSYDGRIFGTARALLLHPGKLTREHFDGRRDVLRQDRVQTLLDVPLFVADRDDDGHQRIPRGEATDPRHLRARPSGVQAGSVSIAGSSVSRRSSRVASVSR